MARTRDLVRISKLVFQHAEKYRGLYSVLQTDQVARLSFFAGYKTGLASARKSRCRCSDRVLQKLRKDGL